MNQQSACGWPAREFSVFRKLATAVPENTENLGFFRRSRAGDSRHARDCFRGIPLAFADTGPGDVYAQQNEGAQQTWRCLVPACVVANYSR